MGSGEWLERALLELRGKIQGMELDSDLISGLVSFCELAPPQDAADYLTLNVLKLLPLDDDLLESVGTGKDVSYEHLRIFDCRVFVQIPRNERSKLDATCKQFIFSGYAHEEFGCRLYDQVDRNAVRSRDVVFLEDQTGGTEVCFLDEGDDRGLSTLFQWMRSLAC